MPFKKISRECLVYLFLGCVLQAAAQAPAECQDDWDEDEEGPVHISVPTVVGYAPHVVAKLRQRIKGAMRTKERV